MTLRRFSPARNQRTSSRNRAAAAAAVADAGRTIAQAAQDHQVSCPVVAQAFAAYANSVLLDEPEPVAALGIDEIRRGKPRWTYDEQAESWT